MSAARDEPTSTEPTVAEDAALARELADATGALLELARQRGVEAFVIASTNAVVGAYDGTFTERVPLGPLTPYGATKAAAEMLSNPVIDDVVDVRVEDQR